MLTLQIAFRNLLSSRKRTAFLFAALFLVTFLLVMLLSLTQGIRDNLIRTATSIASGHVNVGGFYKTTPSDASPIVTGTPELKRIVNDTLGPDVDRVVDRVRGWGKVISDKGSVQTGLTGIDLDDEGDLQRILTLAPEREYKEHSDNPDRVKGDINGLKRPGGIVLFAGQAKRLQVDVGDPVTLRTETLRGASNTAEAVVVAVVRDLGPMSSWSTFIGKETVMSLYQFKPDVSGAVQVYLKDIGHSEMAMAKLRTAFEQKGYRLLDHESNPFFMKFQTVSGEDWTGQKLDINTWEDEASFLKWILAALQSVSFALVALLAVIIAVGIMNTMYIAVRERTREIGTLRAIGMSQLRVLALFLAEACVLGLAATSAGALAAVVLSGGIDAAHVNVDVEAMRAILLSDTLHLAARANDVVAAVLSFTAITMVAALWPSLRASRIPPVVAMQSAE